MKMLTPPEVARELKVSPATVREWIHSGKLNAVRLGDSRIRPRFRITRESLEAFIASRAVVVNKPQPQRRRKQSSDYTRYY